MHINSKAIFTEISRKYSESNPPFLNLVVNLTKPIIIKKDVILCRSLPISWRKLGASDTPIAYSTMLPLDSVRKNSSKKFWKVLFNMEVNCSIGPETMYIYQKKVRTKNKQTVSEVNFLFFLKIFAQNHIERIMNKNK
jgi:hypothetical protein